MGRFWRRLRASLGRDLPYAWVPEWHPKGHGLHVHFGVGEFVARRLTEAAWGHGFVHIKLLGARVGRDVVVHLLLGHLPAQLGSELAAVLDLAGHTQRSPVLIRRDPGIDGQSPPVAKASASRHVGAVCATCSRLRP